MNATLSFKQARRLLQGITWSLGLLSDVLLWLVVVAAILALLRWLDVDGSWHQRQQHMTLQISDANSLVKGSDVRLMGVTVGTVKSVRPINSEKVEIVFTLMRDTPPIPQNANATVVFSGLGGSKSVEFEVPQNTSTANAIGTAWPSPFKVETPVRLREAFQYQIDMSKAIEKGSKSLTAGLDNTSIRNYQRLMHDNRRLSAQTVEQMRGFDRQAASFKGQLLNTTRQLNTVVTQFDRETSTLRRHLLDPEFKRKTRKGYQYSFNQGARWETQTRQLHEQLVQGQTPYQLGLAGKQQYLRNLASPLPHLLERQSQTLGEFDQRMTSLSSQLGTLKGQIPTEKSDKIEQLDRQIRQINAEIQPTLRRLDREKPAGATYRHPYPVPTPESAQPQTPPVPALPKSP